jgi:hypothetical protein
VYTAIRLLKLDGGGRASIHRNWTHAGAAGAAAQIELDAVLKAEQKAHLMLDMPHEKPKKQRLRGY